MSLQILYEDNHLLAINKPAGIPTMGAKHGADSLIEQAKKYIKAKHSKPGNVYLGVVSRVDSLVSGVVIFARTSKAAARLSEQFATGTVRKTYWAVVERPPEPAQGTLVDWLWHNDAMHRVVVASADKRDAKEAKLDYRTRQRLGPFALVEIRLITGRKHQIRVQFASRDCAILGDRKYDSSHAFSRGIALHARQLEIKHPVRDETISITAEVPPSWHRWGIDQT